MSYTKTNWQNTPSTQTPISAANLNHMEQGIYDAAQTADSAQSGVDGLDPRMDLVEQRLDNLIPQGTPTQGNAELIDIRVGANGVTYPDAGSAVRGQVTEIKSALSDLEDDFSYEVLARTNADTRLENDLSDEALARTNADNHLDSFKVNMPLDEYNQPTDGTQGQSLRTNGDGTTEWADVGLPTDEQTADAINDWLTAHPEATTTVQDGSITEVKINQTYARKIVRHYVSVSAMQGDTDLKVGMLVMTDGYYGVNDGGSAIYSVVSAEPSGYYEELNNGLYAEMLIIDNTVNIRQFGIQDGDDCATLFTDIISKYDNIVFVGNYVCNTTIVIEGRTDNTIPQASKKLYFKGCTITVKSNVNMFEFTGSYIDMYDGEFIVDPLIVFNHAIMYFGPHTLTHRNINIYRSRMKGPKPYTGNVHSNFENQLSQFDTNIPLSPIQYPDNGSGIMMYGSTTSPYNSTVFCNFIDYVIEGFGIGVYLLSYSTSNSVTSYFNSCKFCGDLYYTGKGYVVVGDNTGIGYPCDILFSGCYQTGAQSVVDGDGFDNIIYGGRGITFDVKVWDSNRRICENHLSRYTEPTQRVLQDGNNAEGFDAISISHPNGRFSSCKAMQLEYTSKDRAKYCVAYVPSEIVSNSLIFRGRKEIADKEPEFYIRYAGCKFFSIKDAQSLSLSFKMKHDNADRINVLAWAYPIKSSKIYGYTGLYPLVRNSTYGAVIVSDVDTVNRTITIDRDVTVPTSNCYCIPEGHRYRNITYNDSSSPCVNPYTNLPKVTAVNGRVITLDSKMDNETIVIGQQVTFAQTGNTEYTDKKLIGSQAPSLSNDFVQYSFINYDLDQLRPYENIYIFIQFYYLNGQNVAHDYWIKDVVLSIE